MSRPPASFLDQDLGSDEEDSDFNPAPVEDSDAEQDRKPSVATEDKKVKRRSVERDGEDHGDEDDEAGGTERRKGHGDDEDKEDDDEHEGAAGGNEDDEEDDEEDEDEEEEEEISAVRLLSFQNLFFCTR